ncbi:MAG TPA: hypothetical protein VG693_01120, partial [Actinomycetes bacterium]|nr:hypothetical protein [Actinomycetes bacterium]
MGRGPRRDGGDRRDRDQPPRRGARGGRARDAEPRRDRDGGGEVRRPQAPSEKRRASSGAR